MPRISKTGSLPRKRNLPTTNSQRVASPECFLKRTPLHAECRLHFNGGSPSDNENLEFFFRSDQQVTCPACPAKPRRLGRSRELLCTNLCRSVEGEGIHYPPEGRQRQPPEHQTHLSPCGHAQTGAAGRRQPPPRKAGFKQTSERKSAEGKQLKERLASAAAKTPSAEWHCWVS